jgi:hypothetical protein
MTYLLDCEGIAIADAFLEALMAREEDLYPLVCSAVCLETQYTLDIVAGNPITFESAMGGASSVREYLIRVIQVIGKKIKELWEKFIGFIKRSVYHNELGWYQDNNTAIALAIKDSKPHLIGIRNYIHPAPVMTVCTEISDTISELGIFYDKAQEIIGKLTNHLQHKTLNAEETDKIRMEMEATWKLVPAVFRNLVSIENPLVKNVMDTINQSHFKKGALVTVDARTIVPSPDIADLVMKPENIQKIEKLCTCIKQGSSRCIYALKLFTDTTDALNSRETHNASELRDIATLEKDCLVYVRQVLTLCDSVGQAYWNLFMLVRQDVITALKEFVYGSDADKHVVT